MLKVFAIAALAALTVACDNGPRLRVDVQGSSFERVPVAGSGLELAAVTFEVTNDGDGTAFVPACDRRIAGSVDKRVGGRWEQAYGEICLANLMADPVLLRAGARQQGGVGLGESGQYRIKVSYAADASMNKWKSAVSEAFDVR